jgi:transposase-like protein
MKKQRKRYSAEDKVAVLRRHLVEGAPVWPLCDELGLHPTMFYRGRKDLFENPPAVRGNGAADSGLAAADGVKSARRREKTW